MKELHWDDLTLLGPGGGAQAFLDIASKRLYVVIQNFLTFPKYQKQKFWKKIEFKFFPPTPLGGGY